jgi:hypothetical protein
MPAQKFRSIAETPPLTWRRAGGPELYRALARLWRTSQRLHPRRFPAGVYRHRTMDAMNRQRDEWNRAYVASLRRDVANRARRPTTRPQAPPD